LEAAGGKEGEKKLDIICDNVRYQHTGALKEAAGRLKIKLAYLPGYSPNLNLIERYWGYLKKAVMANKYYEAFELFKGAVLNFYEKQIETVKRIAEKIYT
jgi:transposase